MPGGAYSVYAADVSESIQGSVLSYNSSPFTTSSSGNTNLMPVSAPLGMNLAGVLVEAVVIVTPSSSTAVVGGSTTTDTFCSGYEVTNQVGGGVRCKTITRGGAEEAERIYLQSPATSGSPFVYPHASAATFTATTAATTNNYYLYIPSAGGQAVNVKFYYAGSANTFSTTASITSISTTYNLYAVPTLSNARTAFQEVQSRTLGAGQQDIRETIPDGMSPDLCSSSVGYGTSSSTIGKIVVDAQGGAGRSVDFEDNSTGTAVSWLYPPTGASQAGSTRALFNMHKQRADHLWVTTNASFSATMNILYCEIDDGSPLVPTLQAAPSATTPLATQTATTGPGGAGVLPKGGGARGIGITPRRF